MLLIGTMNLTRTVGEGMFYCPTCRSHQPYRLRSRRPFLTIYFIPVVPVGGAEPFVQCNTCKASWDTAVLQATQETQKEQELQQFREDALRATVLITTADGTITEEEIEAIMLVADRLLDRPIDRDQLGALCASAQRLRISPLNYIRSVKTGWTKEQSIVVLQAAFLAASAGGELNSAQSETLSQLQDLFELTTAEYEDAIEYALSLT